jgi:hypothetical protein
MDSAWPLEHSVYCLTHCGWNCLCKCHDKGAKHDPVPPEGCQCASFWTIRGTHKNGCPLAKAASDEAAMPGTRETKI